MTYPAVERNIMLKQHNGRQRQYTESTYYSDHGITCLGSEIEPQFLSEESTGKVSLNEFVEKRVKFKFSEPQIFEVNSLKEILIDQRNLKFVDSKCERPAFDHDSNIGMTYPAVERNIMLKQHNGKQRQYTESTHYSDHGITCLG
jgi:hypothetical protein